MELEFRLLKDICYDATFTCMHFIFTFPIRYQCPSFREWVVLEFELNLLLFSAFSKEQANDENLKISSECGIAHRFIFHLEFSVRFPLLNHNTLGNALWFILSADHSAAELETGRLPEVKNIMALLCTRTRVKGCFECGIWPSVLQVLIIMTWS